MAYWDMLIRPAEPGDALAVARVHVRSWQAAYRKLLPDDYLDQLRPEDRAQKYDFANADPLKPKTIVAVEDGAIRGFASVMPSRDPDLPGHGELGALYLEPEQWGRGIGVALVSSARACLWELHQISECGIVGAGGQCARGLRFYRNDGWIPDGLRRTDTVWGVTVDEFRYQRRLEAS